METPSQRPAQRSAQSRTAPDGLVTAKQRRNALLRLGSKGLLMVWIPLLIIGLGTLMASHWAALPKPSIEEPHLADALEALGAGSRNDQCRVHAFHVLDGACRCSRRVAEHLMESERPTDAAETVLLIGANEELHRNLERAGFGVESMEREEVARSLGFTSAPMLLVTSRLADGRPTLRYSGGYTARQQALEIQDTAIIAGLLEGATPSSLPIFGCGTTASIQAALDPLGLKY